MRLRLALLATLIATLLIPPTTSAQVGENGGLLNPNLASEDELAAVPHVGRDGAARIVAGRPWLSVSELHAAIGADLDDARQDELYAALWLPLDLDRATEEEIRLIPGVGSRMSHEFEEYRPYVALARFRREIGKYVDAEEVARLEQYVFVRLDLNSATSEQLATIPGIGPRMIHEFEEYRPYRAMAEFRREIGKYVDEDEVARFERYVTIR